MNILEKLGKKYSTDKIGKHNYLPVYYDLFKDRRESVKKVVEIGVGEGAGLRMWRDFFPNAEIIGAEIEKSRLFREKGIFVILFDQTSAKDISELVEIVTGTDVDLIIDDGSHKSEDQLFTCLGIMSLLKGTNVIYIIEDVADPSIVKYLTKYDVEVIECGKRYDDRLIIVKNKNG